MNTSKILDIVPAPVATPSQTPAGPARPEPKAVQPIGGGATTDLIQQRAQRQAEAAAVEAEEKKRAAKPYVRPQNFDREVGLVGESFEVFVDLVNSTVGDHRFRIFGPPDKTNAPAPTDGTPAAASAAYADAARLARSRG